MECVFCDKKATSNLEFTGGAKWPVCDVHAWQDGKLEMKPVKTWFKASGFKDITAERQARRDFANKYYCGY